MVLNKSILSIYKQIEVIKMHNKFINSLGILLIFIISTVQADCIVTTENFTKSSRVIYINPTNGSDQLAKNYNYNLGTLRNPYEPKLIVAFETINEALAERNLINGDLVLIKTGETWTNYDDWSQNKLAEFNSINSQISTYSQNQCKGEKLTWVPPIVKEQQSIQTFNVADSNNKDELKIANAEIVSPNNTLTHQTLSNTSQNTTILTSPKKTTGGGRDNSAGSATKNLNIVGAQENQSYSSESTGNDFFVNQPNKIQVPKSNLADVDEEKYLDPPISEIVLNEEIDGNNQVDENKNLTSPDKLKEDTNDNDLGLTDEYYSQVTCDANTSWEYPKQSHSKDKDGWTIIKPDNETRFVYVSSTSGSDSYARPYSSGEISDPFNPPSNVSAYKTLQQAYAQLRDRKPDWILLKKGDKFELQNALRLKSGKSKNAHMVISSYGDSKLPRPIIDSYTSTAIAGNKVRSFITVSGIEFYASGRDPKSERFVGWDNVGGASGISYVAGGDSYDIHIENNLFRFYSGGIGMQGHAGEIKDIIIRRNQVLNSYSTTAHSQGLFLSKLNGALIEENLLDHNGWYQQRPSSAALNTKTYGYATVFNHNLYMENSSNLVIRKNISSRSSSIGMKFTSNSDNSTRIDTINSRNILLDNNLIIEGEVGFSIGGNTDFDNGFRWDNIKVVNNVLSNIGRTRPTNRSLGFNIEVNDWKTGSVCNNAIVDRDNKSITNNYGIDTKGTIGNLNISNNQIINLGIEQEAYSKSDNIDSINNKYIPLINNVNYLDNYVKSKGYIDYSTYINSVREKLKNSSSAYYNVEDAIGYIKLQANY